MALCSALATCCGVVWWEKSDACWLICSPARLIVREGELFPVPAPRLVCLWFWFAAKLKAACWLGWEAAELAEEPDEVEDFFFFLLPPIIPGAILPVSWYLLRIFDTQPWDTFSMRLIWQGRVPLCANSMISFRLGSGSGRPFMKTPPSWLHLPCPCHNICGCAVGWCSWWWCWFAATWWW